MSAEVQFAGKEHAKIYSKFRRDIPGALAEKIVSYLKEKYNGHLDLAVDVGCGNGQSSVILAPFFKKVHGMDVSEAQILEAKKSRLLSNLDYSASAAEVLPFEDGSVQLVTAASALHWFNLDTFFPEVRRILCNNGVLAVYCYYAIKPLLEDPEQALKIDKLYSFWYETTKQYHAPQAQIAIERYKSVTFPFEEVLWTPDFRDKFEGHLSDIVGYVSTFSGFQNLKKQDSKRAEEVISEFESRLKEIAAASNISEDDTITLFRDFLVIICRKMDEK